jgi:glycosyltransferase involved in cell wall biosynthesis
MQLFSIIIPTRNRSELLHNVLSSIDFNEPNLIEVIVVDSSDFAIKLQINQEKIKYFHTSIKSAATQRNIGINNLNKITEIVFFVDDDVILPQDYFKQLNSCLCDIETIGASGLAINYNSVRGELKGISGIYRRIFLLDSKRDGILLPSAINIPVRTGKNSLDNLVETQWLIGCSAWKSTILENLRFENKFKGQSLGEDVLFSNKARKLGKLKVNKTVILNHLESKIERPNLKNFYAMWVSNRYEISRQLHLSWFNLAFHWANIGKFIITSIRWDFEKKDKKSIIRGIMAGYYHIYFSAK